MPTPSSNSLTVVWTSQSNYSFRVTAEDVSGKTPNLEQRIDFDSPDEATFRDLEGGTVYRVAVFTFNGSMESDPVSLNVATCKLLSVRDM